MRYLPLSSKDRDSMLGVVGVKSIDDLFKDLPKSQVPDNLPLHQSEIKVERDLIEIAKENLSYMDVPSFLGAGNYCHHIPASLDYLIQRGEFLTSYTPYQPEISQGTLQAVFEFQTQVALITGMEIANASMYDGATACSEAISMAHRINKRSNVLISGGVHPHYIDVAQTQLKYLGLKMDILEPDLSGLEDFLGRIDNNLSSVIVQNPSFFGNIKDYQLVAETCHAKGVLLIIVVTEPVSLGVIKSPGEMGADIVVGEGQSLASPSSFGGPGVGFFASLEKYVRQMPGRLCGQTFDANGQRGFVLTMSTREQHIRREKATSNICTNSGLIALAFSIHLSLLGENGFTRLAEINHLNSVELSRRLKKLDGVKVLNNSFFNEFLVLLPRPASEIINSLADQNILAGVPVSRFYPKNNQLTNMMLVTTTEINTENDLNLFIDALGREI